MLKTCAGCGVEFESKRSDKRYHDATCRKRGSRRGPVEVDVTVVQAPTSTEPALVAAYRAKLAEVDRVNTPEGQHVLLLAQKMTNAFETGSGVAALSRQLDAVYAQVMKGVNRGDALDDLTRRRQEKLEAAARAG